MSSKQKSDIERKKIKQFYKMKSKNLILFFVIVAIVGFALFDIVSKQVQIAQKNNELNSINIELENTLAANEQLQHYLAEENRNEYIEQIARDELDYSYPDEKIYYFVPGD